MNLYKYLLITLTAVLLQGTFMASTPDSIESIVSLLQNKNKVVLSDEIIFSPHAIATFYFDRGLKTAWMDEQGINIKGLTALNVMFNVKQEGLNPDDYHYQKILSIKQLIDKSDLSPSEINKLRVHADILLSDGYLLLLRHIRSGKLDRFSNAPVWSIHDDLDAVKYADFLGESILYNRVEDDYKKYLPQQPRYQALKKALAELQAKQELGNWSKLSTGDKLELDSVNTRVAALKLRLREEDYVVLDTVQENVFDMELDSVVKQFQINNGLLADGVVGPATIQILNISMEERIQQIILNLERWRWYEDDLITDHLRVNIANFNLEVVKDQTVVFECKAIVGKTARKTPEFNGMMRYIVINPYWTIPPGILKNDIIPSVKKDSSYLDRKKIRVIQGGTIYDAKKINWETVDIWKYIYRQDPGKHNSMGLIKFMFPNRHNVYIHDTPNKNLFNKAERTFSSGCIRIQKPVQLAEFLLKDQDDWDLDKIMKTLEDKNPKVTVGLDKYIPVRTLYYTAWAEKGISIQYRKDIYKKDKKVWKGLITTRPVS